MGENSFVKALVTTFESETVVRKISAFVSANLSDISKQNDTRKTTVLSAEISDVKALIQSQTSLIQEKYMEIENVRKRWECSKMQMTNWNNTLVGSRRRSLGCLTWTQVTKIHVNLCCYCLTKQ